MGLKGNTYLIVAQLRHCMKHCVSEKETWNMADVRQLTSIYTMWLDTNSPFPGS